MNIAFPPLALAIGLSTPDEMPSFISEPHGTLAPGKAIFFHVSQNRRRIMPPDHSTEFVCLYPMDN